MSEPNHEAIQKYKDYIISIFPVKKYCKPADPYKIWKDYKDVTMIDRKIFFPIRYKDETEITPEKVYGSIAMHLYHSGTPEKGNSGSVYELLKKDIARFLKLKE